MAGLGTRTGRCRGGGGRVARFPLEQGVLGLGSGLDLGFNKGLSHCCPNQNRRATFLCGTDRIFLSWLVIQWCLGIAQGHADSGTLPVASPQSQIPFPPPAIRFPLSATRYPLPPTRYPLPLPQLLPGLRRLPIPSQRTRRGASRAP